MKKYYSNVYRGVFLFALATIMLGPLSYTMIQSAVVTEGSTEIVASVILSILLLGAYYFVYFSLKNPVVIIDGVKIFTRDYFLNIRVVEDLQQYQLVVSSTFLAFRKEGLQDIMVNRASFSNDKWQILVNDLKALQFSGFIDK